MVSRPVRIAVVAVAIILLVGTMGYMTIEEWSFLDSLWMVLITLTTIGFGEIHPLSALGRVFTMGLIVAGVSVGGYAMSALTQLMVEGEFVRALRTRRRMRTMRRLNHHYVVVGYGRLGRTIAEELRAEKVGVAIVERDPALVQQAERDGFPAIPGDGTDDELLKQAGIARAKGLAVAIPSGAEAVYVTMSARQLNGDLNIVTRVADTGQAAKAVRAGATSVVNPHVMGGWRMAHGLLRPHASSFLDLATLATHDEIAIDELAVPEGSALAGRTLGQLGLAEQGVLIVAVRRTNGTLVPTPRATAEIHAGDVLIALGAPAAMAALERKVGS